MRGGAACRGLCVCLSHVRWRQAARLHMCLAKPKASMMGLFGAIHDSLFSESEDNRRAEIIASQGAPGRRQEPPCREPQFVLPSAIAREVSCTGPAKRSWRSQPVVRTSNAEDVLSHHFACSGAAADCNNPGRGLVMTQQLGASACESYPQRQRDRKPLETSSRPAAQSPFTRVHIGPFGGSTPAMPPMTRPAVQSTPIAQLSPPVNQLGPPRHLQVQSLPPGSFKEATGGHLTPLKVSPAASFNEAIASSRSFVPVPSVPSVHHSMKAPAGAAFMGGAPPYSGIIARQ